MPDTVTIVIWIVEAFFIGFFFGVGFEQWYQRMMKEGKEKNEKSW